MSKRVAIYLRVSTTDKGQTTDNQRLELEKVAAHRGWSIVATYEDQISGAKGRDKRPGLDAMLKDATRGKFDVIASWSVDRLGRSLQDLVGMMADVHAAGVDLYLHQQAVDTTTPSGKALFQMCGVFSEFERSMIQERVNAGLARAKAQGKTLGRPKVADSVEVQVRKLKAEGLGMLKIAKTLSIGTSAVQRILKSDAA
jgi:DNA invertase Pin-like site-specific DNA recombinase